MDAFLRNVLVATDGSDSASRALDFAIALARRHGATLTVCTAVDTTAAIAACASPYGFDAGLAIEALEASGRAVLDRAGATVAAAGVPQRTLSLAGSAAAAVVACAEREGCDAIVAGTRGKSGVERLVLGSTAAGILRHSRVPVFVVPPHAAIAAPGAARVLVAVDGSEASEAALRFATKLAESESASLVLCNAIDTRDLLAKASDYGYDPAPLYDDMRATAASVIERCSELVRTGHVAYQADVVNGEPARSIVAAARVEGAGTIVVGTHGRAGLERLLAGSVAEGVVQYATVPVAVVRTSRAHARVP